MWNVDRDALLRALAAFDKEGLSTSSWAPRRWGCKRGRAREDLDICGRGTSENAERLRRALCRVYANDPHIADIETADLLGSIRRFGASLRAATSTSTS
jgi:hypothetical protein